MDRVEKHLQTLQIIIGSEMSSVEFVRDYAQLRFDGPTLTTFTMPVVKLGGKRYNENVCGYRDALCSFIGKELTRVTETEGESLRLFFSGDGILEVSLRKEDSVGPEAAMFSDRGNIYQVWQV